MSTRTITITDLANVQVGDIMTLRSKRDEGTVITGRAVEKRGTGRFRLAGHEGGEPGHDPYGFRFVSATREVPDVKPGTVGTATVRGAKGIRVMRVTNTGGSDPHEMDPNWVSADLVDRGQRVNGWDGTYLHHDSDVTDFVPDAPAPKATRAQVFDVLYPDGIMPNEDMRDSKIDALMALFGGAS